MEQRHCAQANDKDHLFFGKYSTLIFLSSDDLTREQTRHFFRLQLRAPIPITLLPRLLGLKSQIDSDVPLTSLAGDWRPNRPSPTSSNPRHTSKPSKILRSNLRIPQPLGLLVSTEDALSAPASQLGLHEIAPLCTTHLKSLTVLCHL